MQPERNGGCFDKGKSHPSARLGLCVCIHHNTSALGMSWLHKHTLMRHRNGVVALNVPYWNGMMPCALVLVRCLAMPIYLMISSIFSCLHPNKFYSELRFGLSFLPLWWRELVSSMDKMLNSYLVYHAVWLVSWVWKLFALSISLSTSHSTPRALIRG